MSSRCSARQTDFAATVTTLPRLLGRVVIIASCEEAARGSSVSAKGQRFTELSEPGRTSSTDTVRGSITWLVVDHFEWAWSYVKRLGLFSLDDTTQTRVWNDMGHLCAEVARTNTVAAPHSAVLNVPIVRVRQLTKNWHLRRPREEE